MELKEFLEKFLPEYKAKHRTAYINNARANKPKIEVEWDFENFYFPEAYKSYEKKRYADIVEILDALREIAFLNPLVLSEKTNKLLKKYEK